MEPAANSHDIKPNVADIKFQQLMKDSYTLRKEDIIWVLNYLKQKAAEEDPALLGLPQPRLLKNFHHYAEVALMLIQIRHASGQEQSHIRSLLREACHGLLPE